MKCEILTLIALPWVLMSSSLLVTATWFSRPSTSSSFSSYQAQAVRGQPAQSAALVDAEGATKHDADLDYWCPVASRRAVSPYCDCQGSRAFPILDCGHFESSEYMRRVLATKFPISRFGKLLVANSSIDHLDESSLPADKQFSLITFRKTTLRSLDIAALSTSRGSLKRLELVHNKLDKFPFSNLTSFRKLLNLDLYYNELKSIPDYAFGSNRQLKSIDLSFNKISHVGSYAFAELPALERLDLRFNQIKVVNNHAFASALYDNRLLTLDLSSNKMFYLADGAFEGMIAKELILDNNSLSKFPQKHFLPLIRAMVAQQIGRVSVAGNRLQCSCSETSWLVSLSDTYKERVQGFTCSNINNKKLSHLTLGDISCY